MAKIRSYKRVVIKIGTGVLTIVTVFGFLGIWPLIDLIMIAAGKFTDKGGQPVLAWD